MNSSEPNPSPPIGEADEISLMPSTEADRKPPLQSSPLFGDFTQQRSGLQMYFASNTLFCWLSRRRRPMTTFTAIIVIWYAAAFLVSSLEGTLLTPNGLLHDQVMFLLGPVLILLFYATHRLLRRVDDLLDQFPMMIKPNHFDTVSKREQFAHSVKYIRETISILTPAARRDYWILQAVWFALFAAYQVNFTLSNRTQTDSWSFSMMAHPVGYTFVALWNLFYLLIVFGNASWYVLAVGFTVFRVVKRYADNNALWIVPNAPDGEGGLSPIGSVAFAMTFTLWPCLILIAVDLQQSNYDPALLIGTAALMALSCFVFFWPLYSTHDAMSRAKRAELYRVAHLFRQEYARLPSDGTEAGGDLMPRLDRMSRLAELHAAVKAMPVWPFDMATIRKFFLLLSTPFISALLQKAWPTEWSEGFIDLLKHLAN